MAALQAKLLSAEEAYNARLAAETELLASQAAEVAAELEAERATACDLQEQLGRREHQLVSLQAEHKAVLDELAAARNAAAGGEVAQQMVEELQAQVEALSAQLSESQSDLEAKDGSIQVGISRYFMGTAPLPYSTAQGLNHLDV